ncbi:MAG: cysteine hydrolase [Candidatus Melainabacteria bacterium]|nr:cysteine hydrolase [Candidatus Melainabacteria bacterium]
MAKTLLQMLNAEGCPSKLSESALIVVDAQREYKDGALPLSGFDQAVEEIAGLVERSRRAGGKIWFVRHKTMSGAPIFDPDGPYFQIVDELKPQSEDSIIDKSQPSSFVGTDLDEQLKKAGLKNLIVTGFMTHACISTTVRSAHALAYPVTVVASACATRDLPSATKGGEVVKARDLHNATLAALKDLFAVVASDSKAIAD